MATIIQNVAKEAANAAESKPELWLILNLIIFYDNK